jgi:protocatechuate 3,4-dioxygenase beta subunit
VTAAACTAGTATPSASTEAAAQSSSSAAGAAGVPTALAPKVAGTSFPSFRNFAVVISAADCKPPMTVTTESTEGPYFKAGSPQRSSLVTDGMAGTRITLIGLVMTRSCTPVVDAKVDFRQADAGGSYDNNGYTLRGYVKTDAQGQYRIFVFFVDLP